MHRTAAAEHWRTGCEAPPAQCSIALEAINSAVHLLDATLDLITITSRSELPEALTACWWVRGSMLQAQQTKAAVISRHNASNTCSWLTKSKSNCYSAKFPSDIHIGLSIWQCLT